MLFHEKVEYLKILQKVVFPPSSGKELYMRFGFLYGGIGVGEGNSHCTNVASLISKSQMTQRPVYQFLCLVLGGGDIKPTVPYSTASLLFTL